MSAKYNIISQLKCIDGECHTVYGIEATGEIATEIHDITTDRDKLLKLIDKCNEQALSAIHILDICEDFLALNY